MSGKWIQWRDLGLIKCKKWKVRIWNELCRWWNGTTWWKIGLQQAGICWSSIMSRYPPSVSDDAFYNDSNVVKDPVGSVKNILNFLNYPLTQEGPLAFPTLTFRCREEEPPFQIHPSQARQQKRWWENIITSVLLNSKSPPHQIMEAMKTVDTLLISYNPGLPWTSYNLPLCMTS